MRAIFNILKNATNLVFGFSSLYFLGLVYSLIKNHGSAREYTKQPIFGSNTARTVAIVVLSVTLILSLALDAGIQQLIGLDNIYLKEEGYYTYYVEMDGDAYPARIHVYKEDLDDRGYRMQFYLDQVQLDNGNIITFEDEYELEVNDGTYVEDSESDFAEYVTLLNKHAYSPKLNETNDVTAFSVIFLLLKVSVIITVLIVVIKQGNLEKES